TVIQPFNPRRVVISTRRKVTTTPSPLRKPRDAVLLERQLQSKLSKNTPQTKNAKQIIAQLGKATREVLAEARLQKEIADQLRAQLLNQASTRSTKDRRHVSKARVITAEDVERIFEKQQQQEAEKLAKQNARQNKKLAKSLTIPSEITAPSKKPHQRKVQIV